MQPDSFYLNVLPFAEDVREFQFPSFTNFPASWQPNGQQLEAAANLIKTLDLAPHGQEEVLLPDFTPNPVLEVLILFTHVFLVYVLTSAFIRIYFHVSLSSVFLSLRRICNFIFDLGLFLLKL